jgi:hypothetical protein
VAQGAKRLSIGAVIPFEMPASSHYEDRWRKWTHNVAGSAVTHGRRRAISVDFRVPQREDAATGDGCELRVIPPFATVSADTGEDGASPADIVRRSIDVGKVPIEKSGGTCTGTFSCAQPNPDDLLDRRAVRNAGER